MGKKEQKIKFPFVVDYWVFERVDIRVAEELLSEYNDFYGYAQTLVAEVDGGPVPDLDDERSDAERSDDKGDMSQKTARFNLDRLEHNKTVAVEHFKKLFGSKDFAEACLVGLKIDFDGLYNILDAERRRGTPITESGLNKIAPKLRNLATTLLYAERIVGGLERLLDNTDGDPRVKDAVGFARDGFNILLERQVEEEVTLPEYNRVKKEIGKIKTAAAYIDYCEKLFFIKE